MAVRLTGKQRKSQIMEKALRLFAVKGFHGTTIREIADACGITQAILYQHFDNKEGIYLETQRQIRDEVIEIWRAMVDEAPNAFEGFKEIVMRQANAFGKDAFMGSLFIHGMGATTFNETYKDLMESWFIQQHKFLIKLLEDGLKDGSVKPDTEIDFILWQIRGLLWSLLTSAILDFKVGIDLTKCVRYINKILLSISNGDG